MELAANGASLRIRPPGRLPGNADVWATASSWDAAGSAHVIGTTTSSNFPVTGGAVDTTRSQAKRPRSGRLLLAAQSIEYRHLFGGSGNDQHGHRAGQRQGPSSWCSTNSADLGTSSGALQTALARIRRLVARLSSSGNSFNHVTYLGGTGDDGGKRAQPAKRQECRRRRVRRFRELRWSRAAPTNRVPAAEDGYRIPE